MLHKNEKQILNIIKYAPSVFIISISTIIIIFLYLEKQFVLSKQKELIKINYIKSNKEQIQSDIEKLQTFISKVQNETEEKLKEELKNRVYEAYSIAKSIYSKNLHKKSKDEIKQMIKDALVDIRFNNQRGYFYIYSFDYECILLPISRDLEGTNFYNFKDSKGKFLTRDIITQLKQSNEGFMTWWFPKPDDLENSYKKIGFNIYFEPLDWFIGTGDYFIDFEKSIKNEVISYIEKLDNETNNHYFVLDYDKNIIFHLNKSYINKPQKDVDFFDDKEKIINDIIYIAKNSNGSFISYLPKNKNFNEIGSTKTLYTKSIDSWNWAIGKVFHQSEINSLFQSKELELNNQFKNNIFNIFLVAFTITFFLIIFSRYISLVLEKKFLLYKEEIDSFIAEKEKQHHILSQQSKMAAMGEMLGSIAHQWRQPLSLISTISSGLKLQKELDSLNEKELTKSLDQITQTTIYLSNTIDDFRNFYKSNKKEKIFSLKNIVEKTIKLIEAQIKSHNITLITSIKDFDIFGLENEFLQALINILNNSKDALENIDSARYIFINTFKKDKNIIIEIYDNANGVEEDILDRIAEPYFTTKESTKGTGIGLYMTNEIIQKHMKGKLSFKNLTFYHDKNQYKGLYTLIELN